MNHDEAVASSAADRYLLGELSPDERDRFEQHYFECSECAADVQTGAMFIDNARENFRREKAAAAAEARRTRGSWFAWLTPTFAGPAFAALALVGVVGYQHSELVALNRPQVGKVVLLRAARAASRVVQVRKGEVLHLTFDLNSTGQDVPYILTLAHAAGKVGAPIPIAPELAGSTVELSWPSQDLDPGEYNVTVRDQKGDGGNRCDVSRRRPPIDQGGNFPPRCW